VAALAAFALLPRPGLTPGLPDWLREPPRQSAAADMAPVVVALAQAELPSARKRSAVRERPARRIDNAVRRRALEAVERALAAGDSPA
jgi:hypothetical protein